MRKSWPKSFSRDQPPWQAEHDKPVFRANAGTAIVTGEKGASAKETSVPAATLASASRWFVPLVPPIPCCVRHLRQVLDAVMIGKKRVPAGPQRGGVYAPAGWWCSRCRTTSSSWRTPHASAIPATSRKNAPRYSKVRVLVAVMQRSGAWMR